MIVEIKYKLQGKGTETEFDSWFVFFKDENRVPELITNDYTGNKMDLSNVDLSKMTEQQRTDLINILSI